MKTTALTLFLGLILAGCSNPSGPGTQPQSNVWHEASERYPDSLKIYSDHVMVWSEGQWTQSSSFAVTNGTYSFTADFPEASESYFLAISPDTLKGLDNQIVHTGGFSQWSVTFIH